MLYSLIPEFTAHCCYGMSQFVAHPEPKDDHCSSNARVAILYGYRCDRIVSSWEHTTTTGYRRLIYESRRLTLRNAVYVWHQTKRHAVNRVITNHEKPSNILAPGTQRIECCFGNRVSVLGQVSIYCGHTRHRQRSSKYPVAQ